MSIRNARPFAGSLSLDHEGFDLIEHRSATRDFYDDDQIKQIYYPEAERALKNATGADRIFIFDHTVRRRVRGAEDRRGGPRQPVARVHVDHTARSGPQRVRDLLGDDAEELLRGRVQIINVWRPIRGPLRDAPLAVCDARSVRAEDLVPSDLVYPNRTGETYAVTYNPAHRWFYFPEMQPTKRCCSSATIPRMTAARGLHPIPRSAIRRLPPTRRRARASNCEPSFFIQPDRKVSL